MKPYKFLIALCCAAFITVNCPLSASAKVNNNQEQLDSMAVSLAKRLEAGAFQFTATKFTGTNNICADYLDEQKNTVIVKNDDILIRLDFVGARISAAEATPHQRGRAIAGAAAAVHFGGMLPNYVKVTGKIDEKSASIGRKSKSVTLKITYTIEDTNLDLLSAGATADLFVNTINHTARIVFHNMNLDGTLEGKIILP